MAETNAKTSGALRVAQLLIALGPESAAQVLRALSEDEVAELSAEVANVGIVTAEERRAVVNAFYELAEAQRLTLSGGEPYAERALAHGFGEEQASVILDRVRRGDVRIGHFDEFEALDPLIVRDMLRDEHPQTIAVVVAHFRPTRAAAVVSALDEDVRSQVVLRIAGLGQVQSDTVARIQATMRSKIEELPSIEEQVDGRRLVARILKASDKETEEMILEQMAELDAELAQEIGENLFLFEDIAAIDPRSVQKILRDVDAKTLSVAMKGATPEVQQVIFNNMSKRAAAVLRSELEVAGPAVVTEVEFAQKQVIEIVRKLEADGEIVVPRGGEDE